MTKVVLFDAGHTLLYAHPDLGTVYAEATAELGVRLPPARYAGAFLPAFRSFVKGPSGSEASDEQDYMMWRTITRSIYDSIEELRPVDFEAWFRKLHARFGESAVWRCYDDVEPTLRALKRKGLGLGVVSNWDTRLRGICAGLGLDRLVDFIVISAEVGVRKPDPRIFEAALRKAGARPEEALHVGDLPEEDVEGARRAGILPLLVDRRANLHATPRDYPLGVSVLGSLSGLLDLIK